MIRMQRFASAMALVIGLTASAVAPAAHAQSTEERFQDLFVTAGYCTAFGAALGTAFLAFQQNPAANLQFVAMGASLGFIGGSVLGGYIVFSPILADDTQDGVRAGGTLAANGLLPQRGVVFRPTYDRRSQTVTSVEGGLTLATF